MIAPEDEKWAPTQYDRALFLALIVLTVAIRASVLYINRESLTEDPDSYRSYAESLYEHHDFLRNGHASAWRPPLYPVILSAFLALPILFAFLVAILHLLCGTATTALTVAVGRALGLRRFALVAGLLVTLDPILLFESTHVMNETLATFLAAFSLGAFARLVKSSRSPWAIASGAAVGLCILTRPAFLLWGLFLWPCIAKKVERRRALRSALLYLAGLAMVLAPWSLRNLVSLGSPSVTTTHGGYTLLLANNEQFYDFLKSRQGSAHWDSGRFVNDWQSRLSQNQIDNELAEDRFAYQLARRSIQTDPGGFIRSVIYRWQSFWRLTPQKAEASVGLRRDLLRMAVTWWYFIEFALALFGLLEIQKRSQPTWTAALLLVLSFVLVHTFYWTDMRMRAPIMPVVALLAMAGCQWIASRRFRNAKDLRA